MRKADNLPPSVPLLCNLGTLTSWNPLGHSRSVTGLIYLYLSRLWIYCNLSIRVGVRGDYSWLRHCATSLKVMSSIPDGFIEIFHWHNPSGRAMSLGLTQPLTEMSTRNISWGYRRPVRRADNLTNFMCRLSWNLGASTSWNHQGLYRPIMVLLYHFTHQITSAIMDV